MKIERLLLIIIYLLNHKRVSAKTLSNQFDVSVRTIQRDIDTLTLARRKVFDVVDYKLNTIASYFSLDTSNHHRALADCYLTYGIYKKLNEL